ncbi:hypothetical protein EJ06DRAFT_557468 [Trichodelitschia bisporula]|uniref:Homeobox domain-containing protein n=1 Tax=Trichodelitschia bisporula TaxID=703511 RepID=A0A6G1HUM5_9PEZI|nr:hypothetical protein EJ06DRAFT_557468 [Trichodelitschia bisporula]
MARTTATVNPQAPCDTANGIIDASGKSDPACNLQWPPAAADALSDWDDGIIWQEEWSPPLDDLSIFLVPDDSTSVSSYSSPFDQPHSPSGVSDSCPSLGSFGQLDSPASDSPAWDGSLLGSPSSSPIGNAQDLSPHISDHSPYGLASSDLGDVPMPSTPSTPPEDTPAANEPVRNRRRYAPKTPIPKSAKTKLKETFEKDKYPTQEALRQLADKLELDLAVVKTFFNNTRARCKTDDAHPPQFLIPIRPGPISLPKLAIPPLLRDRAPPLPISPVSQPSSPSPRFGGKEVRRQGKKRFHPYVKKSGHGQGDCVHQCTFCHESFNRPDKWQRHEEAIHARPVQWVCCAEDVPDVIGGLCPFCDATDVDEKHLAEHRYQECRAKPEEHRVFARKDQLTQHIRQKHSPNQDTERMGRLGHWGRVNAVEVRFLRCGRGECPLVFETWRERIEHVKAKGCLMRD